MWAILSEILEPFPEFSMHVWDHLKTGDALLQNCVYFNTQIGVLSQLLSNPIKLLTNDERWKMKERLGQRLRQIHRQKIVDLGIDSRMEENTDKKL